MPRKTQRAGKNTVSRKAQAYSSIDGATQPPEGVDLKDDEKVLWRQFTQARSAGDWRDFDLLLIAKMVKIEANIRKHQDVLDDAGPIIENKKGTPVENPLLRVIDTLQRQQLALIRSMSLTQTSSDPRTLNASGATDQAALNNIKNKGAKSLLATPIRG